MRFSIFPACPNHIDKEKKRIMSNLNDDVIFDIFSRIPGDILETTFKYECKNWFNMISSSVFIKTHLLHQTKDGILQQVTTGGIVKLMFINLNAMEANKELELITLPENSRVVCSCNGLLLCLDSTSKNMYVTNPMTNETVALRPCNHELHSGVEVRYDLVYVPSTEKYKVVELYYDYANHHPVFHIQTLGVNGLSDSYRRIEEPAFKSALQYISYYESISVSGVLYILVGSGKIICFDVGNETTIKLLSLPTCYSNDNGVDLTEIAGSLSFIRGTRYDQFDVWSLKDVNEGEWVKQFKICKLPANINNRVPPYVNLVVLGSLNDGEVITFPDDRTDVYGQRIFVYSVKTMQWKLMNTTNSFQATPMVYKSDNAVEADEYHE
ncbi:hypothetical protein IFM89_024331 [Coptis chinensis]|uniref:F-box associated beta-propeller type 3 domain-containing protein n=1 Tax=Coptis chinensis TaxID=261450 RepID=A0A835J1T6_9MAGN|nr:hypothetical protein IFM89_024331 [Coptis chinensis]